MSYVALEAITNQSLNMILANEEAQSQTRPFQHYVTVCLSVLAIVRRFSRHGPVVCLSECCHDDQPGEWV